MASSHMAMREIVRCTIKELLVLLSYSFSPGTAHYILHSLDELRISVSLDENISPSQPFFIAPRLHGYVEPEPNAMYGFKVDRCIRLKMLPELGDKNIHTPSQEIIIFPPYVQQYLVSF